MTTHTATPPRVMSPAAWAACDDPAPMLEAAAGRVSARKLTLWACACWRRLSVELAWSWRWRERLRRERRAVEAAELFADGLITFARLEEVRDGVGPDAADAGCPERALAWAACLASCDGGIVCGRGCVRAAVTAVCPTAAWAASEGDAPADTLREVVGDPSRPPAVSPEWLAWEGGTVARLAEEAYRRRLLPLGTLDADVLAVLADAAEEAGCDDEALLAHLRGPGPHHPGCWAVDALSGRS